VAKAGNLEIWIDLTDAEPDLEPEALEELTSNLAEEISDLVEEARLVRESEVPESSKPGLGGFILGLLKTEIPFENAKTLLNFLGDRFYGRTLNLEFKANGREYKLEYHNKQQLEDAIQAIERLSKLN
jgi:hypothetical protein